jgi:hypothetical protein
MRREATDRDLLFPHAAAPARTPDRVDPDGGGAAPALRDSAGGTSADTRD